MNSSFEEWEKLMRAPNSGATKTVMGLITRMFKQTAIAKVLIAGPSCVCLDTNYLMYLIFFNQAVYLHTATCLCHLIFNLYYGKIQTYSK